MSYIQSLFVVVGALVEPRANDLPILTPSPYIHDPEPITLCDPALVQKYALHTMQLVLGGTIDCPPEPVPSLSLTVAALPSPVASLPPLAVQGVIFGMPDLMVPQDFDMARVYPVVFLTLVALVLSAFVWLLPHPKRVPDVGKGTADILNSIVAPLALPSPFDPIKLPAASCCCAPGTTPKFSDMDSTISASFTKEEDRFAMNITRRDKTVFNLSTELAILVAPEQGPGGWAGPTTVLDAHSDSVTHPTIPRNESTMNTETDSSAHTTINHTAEAHAFTVSINNNAPTPPCLPHREDAVFTEARRPQLQKANVAVEPDICWDAMLILERLEEIGTDICWDAMRTLERWAREEKFPKKARPCKSYRDRVKKRAARALDAATTPVDLVSSDSQTILAAFISEESPESVTIAHTNGRAHDEEPVRINQAESDMPTILVAFKSEVSPESVASTQIDGQAHTEEAVDQAETDQDSRHWPTGALPESEPTKKKHRGKRGQNRNHDGTQGPSAAGARARSASPTRPEWQVSGSRPRIELGGRLFVRARADVQAHSGL